MVTDPASTGCKLPPPAREQEPNLPPRNPCSTVPSDPAQTLRIRGLDRKPLLPTARRNGVSPRQWSPRAKTKSQTAGSGVRVCRVKSQWHFPRPKRVPRRAAGVSDLSPDGAPIPSSRGPYTVATLLLTVGLGASTWNCIPRDNEITM